ncbi:hypothetical protein, partial [Pseudoglutamicibacter cumminsii]|uniref:hypothetical protein n=1 Tax=Pseudoglutamicibacter cumminsii TaxID=156979 RepID=UPI0026EF09F4
AYRVLLYFVGSEKCKKKTNCFLEKQGKIKKKKKNIKKKKNKPPPSGPRGSRRALRRNLGGMAAFSSP